MAGAESGNDAHTPRRAVHRPGLLACATGLVGLTVGVGALTTLHWMP